VAGLETSSNDAAYQQVYDDLIRNFWDADNSRIRPTNGCSAGTNGCPVTGGSRGPVGEVNGELTLPSFWQMSSMASFLFWDWKYTGSRRTLERIKDQWAYVRSVWDDRKLSSASPSSLTMNVSDDAAWVLHYLEQVHEATGDSRALDNMVALLPSVLNRWKDTDTEANPPKHYGALAASRYGILYSERGSGDMDHQGRSTTFEAMIANAALYIHRQTGDPEFFEYAVGTYDWMRRYLRHPSGVYWIELDLRKSVGGAPNASYLKAIGHHFGRPQRGCDSTYMAGTMAVAVLAGRLYQLTRDQQYLDEARSIAAALIGPGGYLREGGVFANTRDGWTNGYYFPPFEHEVLPLPSVDPDGHLKGAIRNTALAIVRLRDEQGRYSADWSGPESNACVPRAQTWEEQAARGTGSGQGMAKSTQIMTNATSASVVQAGAMVEARLSKGQRLPMHPESR
jgi:hypothetical protein